MAMYGHNMADQMAISMGAGALGPGKLQKSKNLKDHEATSRAFMLGTCQTMGSY